MASSSHRRWILAGGLCLILAILGAVLPQPVAAASIAPHSFPEGNSIPMQQQIKIVGPFNTGYTVEYWTEDGTATAADNDYVPIARGTYFAVCDPYGNPCPIIFARVTINGDTKLEPDETFTLHTSLGSATITITSEEVDDIPPDTTITAKPNNSTTSANASFSFTGSDSGGSGVASFQCQLDGGAFSACTSPQSYTGLADGSHTFLVRAIDGFGNIDPAPASFTWRIDTTAPDTTITATPPNPTANTSAGFSFAGSDPGGSGVASFQCQIDGGGFSTCTSSKNYTGLGQGGHTFQVRAIDAAGNTDQSPASFTWTIAADPDTTITATPPNPSASANASFSFTGGGGAGALSFECKLDGGGFATCTSPQTYTGLSQGSHTFQVRAVAGTPDPTPASFTWVVDTIVPDTTITANPTNPSASANASFSFSGSDPGGSGVVGFECQIDSGAFVACASPRTYTGLSDGSHTFVVRAVDAAGNADSTPASYTWIIDTTPPPAPVVATPANGSSTNNTQPPVGGTAEPDSLVTVFLDGTAAGSTSASAAGTWTFTPPTPLGNGSHTVRARATDAVGNTSVDSNTNTFIVDTDAPDTTIITNPINPTASTGASFSFTGNDGSGSGVAGFECQLDGAGFAACTSPQTHTGLADGSHTFQVRAIDAAGNTDQSPASFTWLVDTTGPDTTITANPTNPSKSASASFSFTGNDGSGSGVARFECQLDSSEFSTCTSSKDYTDLRDGSHTFRVRAIDAVGNTDQSPATYTWLVDTTAPDTTITVNPANPSNSASASFSFTGNDGTGSGVARFECQLDGGEFSACISAKDYSGLVDGSHTFQVRAIDAAGNIDPTPASFAWTVDTFPPSATITSTTPNPTNISPIPVRVEFSESVADFTADDIATGNGSVSNFAGSGKVYTFDLIPAGQGPVTADIAAGKAHDTAGNGNTAATQLRRTYDSVAPAVTINQAAGQADPADASPINFTVVFSEPVTGFGDKPTDVTLSGTAGATPAVITQVAPNDGTTYNVAVNGMTTGGTVIATIPAGAARDQATNPSAASTSRDNSVTYHIETQIDAVSGATTYGDTTATLTAQLSVRGTNAPIAGRTLIFTLAGQPVCGGSTGRACPTTNAQGVATLSGVPVTKRNAGTYANLVCASFAGAGAYLPSGPTCGALTVTRRVLWVKPADQTVKLKQANPTTCTLVLANGSAFVNGDTWSAVNLTQLRFTYNRNPPATNATEIVGKTYIITAVGATSANYDIRYQTGILTVVAP